MCRSTSIWTTLDCRLTEIFRPKHTCWLNHHSIFFVFEFPYLKKANLQSNLIPLFCINRNFIRCMSSRCSRTSLWILRLLAVAATFFVLSETKITSFFQRQVFLVFVWVSFHFEFTFRTWNNSQKYETNHLTSSLKSKSSKKVNSLHVFALQVSMVVFFP